MSGSKQMLSIMNIQERLQMTTSRLDSSGLDGLRGLVSLHIMLHHSFYHSDYGFSIFGQIHMPLFFLLSGFCLALKYGRRAYKGSTFCCCCCTGTNYGLCEKQVPHQEEEIFNSQKFYFMRMSRILPVYYLCFFIALPLIFLGYGDFPKDDLRHIGSCVFAIFFQSTIFMVSGFGPNGPGWTVCTLFFFYWFFPGYLVMAQKRSNKWLAISLVALFYVQAIIGTLIHSIVNRYDNGVTAYWFGSAHPLSRIPVFFMGIHAGILILRFYNGDIHAGQAMGQFSETNWFLSLVEDAFLPVPWIRKHSSPKSVDEKEKSWTRRTYLNVFVYTAFTLICAVTSTFYIISFKIGKYKKENGEQEVPDGMIAMFWLTFYCQIMFVHLQLMIIVGLCSDGGRSWINKFFKTSVMQFLGRISMSLYLVHQPIIFWISCFLHGPAEWINGSRAPNSDFPVEYSPLHWLISLLLAILITKFIEEPARKKLRQYI